MWIWFVLIPGLGEIVVGIGLLIWILSLIIQWVGEGSFLWFMFYIFYPTIMLACVAKYLLGGPYVLVRSFVDWVSKSKNEHSSLVAIFTIPLTIITVIGAYALFNFLFWSLMNSIVAPSMDLNSFMSCLTSGNHIMRVTVNRMEIPICSCDLYKYRGW